MSLIKPRLLSTTFQRTVDENLHPSGPTTNVIKHGPKNCPCGFGIFASREAILARARGLNLVERSSRQLTDDVGREDSGDYERETNWQYAVGVYMSLTLFNFASDVFVGPANRFEEYCDLMRKAAVAPEILVVAHVRSCFIKFLAGLFPSMYLAGTLVDLPETALGLFLLIPGYLLFVTGLVFLGSVAGKCSPASWQIVGLASVLLMWGSAVFYSKSFIAPVLQHFNPILQKGDTARQLALLGPNVGGRAWRPRGRGSCRRRRYFVGLATLAGSKNRMIE